MKVKGDASVYIALGFGVTTSELHVYLAYEDLYNEIVPSGGKSAYFQAETNGTTPVPICTPPPKIPFNDILSDGVRFITEMTVTNKDTIASEVHIYSKDSLSEITLRLVTLDPGDMLQYTEDMGWNVMTDGGSIKGIGATGPPGPGGVTTFPLTAGYMMAGGSFDGSVPITFDWVSPLTTKGDLFTFSTTDTRLSVGANPNGYVLTLDSATATGLKWAAAAGGGETLAQTLVLGNTTGANDIILSDNAGVSQLIKDSYTGNSNLQFIFNAGVSSVSIVGEDEASLTSLTSSIGISATTAVNIGGAQINLTGFVESLNTIRAKSQIISGFTGAFTGLFQLVSNAGGTIGLTIDAAQAGAYSLTLPTTDSTGTQALVSNGSGVLSWASIGSGLSGLPANLNFDNTTGGYDIILQDTIFSDNSTSLINFFDNGIVSRINMLGADEIRLMTTTYSAYLTEATGLFNITGGLKTSGVNTLSAVTANRALTTNASKEITASATTDVELGYVSGVTSAIQTQLNGKQPLATNLTSLSGLTYASTSFVKMTAAGTFALDTNTYLNELGTTVGATTNIQEFTTGIQSAVFNASYILASFGTGLELIGSTTSKLHLNHSGADITELGDADIAGNGTRLVIDDANKTIDFYNLTSVFRFNGEAILTDVSTATLTNKSGLISQWTNDVGYLTSAPASTIIVGSTTITGGANGRIPYNSSGFYQESANLVWDSVNNQLSILSSGTASLPAVAIGAADLGFYMPVANELGLVTGGAARYRFSSTAINSVTTGSFTMRRAAGAVATPTYAFNGTVGTGMWLNGTFLDFSVAGLAAGGFSGSGVFKLYNAGGTFGYNITAANLAADRTLNIPLLVATDTFAMVDFAQTLTNKTMTGATNVLTASLLKSATTEVDVSAATAPTIGQVLTATSGTAATWQTPSAGGGSGTVTSVTSANADATVATTTTTPVITVVQTPALRSATTTVNVSSATAPTTGQVLTATGASAATWQNPYAAEAYRRSGRYYTSSAIATQATTGATYVNNTIRYEPVIIGKSVTVNALAVYVAAAGSAGSFLRLGLYASDATTFAPTGSPLADSGDMAADGTIGARTATISVAVTPGLYWIAFNHNSTSALQIQTISANSVMGIIGAATINGLAVYGYTNAVTYAAFTTVGTLSTTNTSNACPALFLKW